MSTEITTAQNFEQRMKDRIRDSIGELISDEELAKLVQRSVEELFFKERVTMDRYGSMTDRKPPLLHDIVKELLTEKMTGEIRKWLQDNEATVWQQLNTTVTEGAGVAVVKAITSILHNDFSNMIYSFQNQLRNKGVL